MIDTKKILIYIFGFIILCFLIPIIFTNRDNGIDVISFFGRENNNQQENNNENTLQNYEYKQYGEIKLLHTKTGEIQTVKIDEYLYSVVSAEMPATFEIEALKAQAIVARTYTIYKIQNNSNKHEGADICDDSTCCQAWISKEDRLAKWEESKREENWNKIIQAVDNTKGKIITYEGKAINAFFHSNSGGKTETTANVWGGTGYPYLQSVETAGEDGYSQYNSEVTLSKETFIDKIKTTHNDFNIDFNSEDCIKILEYTDGNRVKKVKIGNLELSGVEVRTIIGLRSANFNVTIQGDNINFKVVGYGHGVGMSQTGADSMAKQGSNYEEIIKHFYVGVKIEEI